MMLLGRQIKLIIFAILFIGLAIILWKGLSRNPHRIPSPFINKAVPIFTGSTLESDNKLVSNKLFRGHVSLLNVFATWCVSCRAEHPILMDIHDWHRVNIYGLNYRDNRAKAKAWLAKYGNPYTKIIFDPQGSIGINFGVYGTPETFLIDRHGIIRYKDIGPISPTEWQETLKPEIIRLEKER